MHIRDISSVDINVISLTQTVMTSPALEQGQTIKDEAQSATSPPRIASAIPPLTPLFRFALLCITMPGQLFCVETGCQQSMEAIYLLWGWRKIHPFFVQ